MARTILETTFLIDFEWERRVGNPGPAQRFIQAHAEDAVYLTFTIAGELHFRRVPGLEVVSYES